jgi:Replication-relaxation
MNGNNRVVLQQRDLRLFQELAVMRVVDREQAKIVASFGSSSRTNARLLALTRAGLLRRFFLGSGGGRKAIYSLSPKGAQAAGVLAHGPRRPRDVILIADYFVGHQLAVNEIYCAVKCGTISAPQVRFQRWLSFSGPVVPGINLVPDGYMEFMTPGGVIACFLEVDLGHESQRIWKQKTQHYVELALSGAFREQFTPEHFRVLVLANSDRRLHSIRKTVAEITQKIFWFATLASVREGFFSPVWFRPHGLQQTSLIELQQ